METATIASAKDHLPGKIPLRVPTGLRSVGFFDPRKPIDVLQTILPYPESIMTDSEYVELIKRTNPPTEPTIEMEPIGQEETKL